MRGTNIVLPTPVPAVARMIWLFVIASIIASLLLYTILVDHILAKLAYVDGILTPFIFLITLEYIFLYGSLVRGLL